MQDFPQSGIDPMQHLQPPAPMLRPDESRYRAALRRQDTLTKPPGSLGRLEALAARLAAQQHRDHPAVDRVRITVFAADHGVCEERVSAFPQAVTAQMLANFAAGGAAINVLAHALAAELEVVNVGTVEALPPMDGVLDQRIASGSANIARVPAMSAEQLGLALACGDRAAARAAEAGAELFIGGEMGIGNTTAASALACALLDCDAAAMVGRGTGVDDEGLARKRAAVTRALARHGGDRDPCRALASLGGLEIAALAGAMLGCGARGIPVLVDGFITGVAALAAVRVAPELRDWLHFAHRSAEPGHERILAGLDAEPLLDLGMRLGEGSGAAVVVPLLRHACALHNAMASFADAGVSDGA